MIISPPFLPAPGNDENAWLDQAMMSPPSRMSSTQAPEGSFPLSNQLCWHNGLHVKGALEANGGCTVRAIADGVVIFASPPGARSQDPKHVQNLNPFGQATSWTDNGCLIIKHTTEIGALGERTTEIVFYSVYMHLSRLGQTRPAGGSTRPWQKDDKIWRKDEVGQAGMVYGEGQRCHLEICLSDAALERLIGRSPAWVDPANIPAPTTAGRIDAVFGAMWIYLPASTPTLPATATPSSHLRGTGQGRLNDPLWVKMTYDRGDCKLESFDKNGQRLGQQMQSGFEYDLYKEACERHKKVPPPDNLLSSPSGWYELLRFGRNLGRGPGDSDKDPLPPTAAHWRKITGPDGQVVWADLNSAGSHQFSDADFLPIQGWQFINDDSTPNDQRCDSKRLKEMIADPDTRKADRLAPDALARRLGDDGVRKKLRRVVCRFPSELQRETIAARYGFVKELDDFRKAPENWKEIQLPHLEALTFANLDAGYLAAQWHFHPREFIGLMRKCGWLSFGEFKQLLPKHAVRTGTYRDAHGEKHHATFWEEIRTNLDHNESTFKSHRIPLNRSFRKYGLTSTWRMVSFFGNAVQETTWLSSFVEGGGGNAWYAPWFGRGFLQLTHPANYIAYWRWRGRNVPETLESALDTAARRAHDARSNVPLQDSLFPALTQEMIDWRNQAMGNERLNPVEGRFSPSDSAGHYAITSHGALTLVAYADRQHELDRQVVPTVDSQGRSLGNRVYYRSQTFWQVSASVNSPILTKRTNYTGLNGFDSRCSAYGVAIAILTEMRFPDARGDATLGFPEGYTPRRL